MRKKTLAQSRSRQGVPTSAVGVPAEMRHLMRKQMIEAMRPEVDYQLIGFGRILVLIGCVVAALVWLR